MTEALCPHGLPLEFECARCRRRRADEYLVAKHREYYGPDEGDAILLADDSPGKERVAQLSATIS